MIRFSLASVLCACLCLAGCSPSQNVESTGNGGTAGSGGASKGGTSGSGGSSSQGGTSGQGGSSGSGGSSAKGGSSGSGGQTSSGGATATGGSSGGSSGGSGGKTGSGGASNSGGSSGSGGASGSGGSKATGGTAASGGSASSGGMTAAGGSTGGSSSAGGSSGSGNCSITVSMNAPSTKMATVGVVEWSTTLANLTSAKIVYTLNNAASTILNKGGTAPVDLKKSNYHTLLLGLKPSSTYTFFVEATSASGTCKSADNTLTTGALSGAPTITRTATNATAQANGFIVTSGGQNGKGAYILDADGTVVWYSDAPSQCSRALMDYEGANMWMMALNVQNGGGEMRYMSMDGQKSAGNVSGLSSAHHDFTVLPGKIATMVWTATGMDPESNLVEHSSDGSGAATTVFKIGSNIYAGGTSAFGGGTNTYHCNAIHYHAADDSYTIGDRNPNLYVKVKHDGTPVWQVGGSCTGAKAPKCAPGTWQINHGHDFDKNGNLLIFNNGQSGASHVYEFKLTETASAITTSTVKDFAPGTTSNVLGDVQRLPNGNTLITYTTAGQILEVDASWATVQTLKGSFGYADWRETLYGPPAR